MKKFAFCFPGQGSQRLGMLDLYAGLPEVKDALAEASAALDEDLTAICADETALNATVNTQPVLVALGVGVYRAWRAAGGAVPELMAGHSLGEFSALVAAGSLTLGQGVTLVRRRAQAMQNAVAAGTGAMYAVLGLGEAEVAQACADTPGDVWVANLNAPGQIVIAGRKEAVLAAAQCCKESGAKRVVELPVSVPSHCPLMLPAAADLAEALVALQLQQAAVPVIQNASCTAVREVPELKNNLVAQLTKPVDWVGCVTVLGSADLVVECGPTKVLHNLNRRILSNEQCVSLDSEQALQEFMA